MKLILLVIITFVSVDTFGQFHTSDGQYLDENEELIFNPKIHAKYFLSVEEVDTIVWRRILIDRGRNQVKSESNNGSSYFQRRLYQYSTYWDLEQVDFYRLDSILYQSIRFKYDSFGNVDQEEWYITDKKGTSDSLIIISRISYKRSKEIDSIFVHGVEDAGSEYHRLTRVFHKDKLGRAVYVETIPGEGKKLGATENILLEIDYKGKTKLVRRYNGERTNGDTSFTKIRYKKGRKVRNVWKENNEIVYVTDYEYNEEGLVAKRTANYVWDGGKVSVVLYRYDLE